MFETLFTYPRVLRRHREGPLAEERAAYLTELAARCVAPATLRTVRSRKGSPRTTHLPPRDAADGSNMADRRADARGDQRRRPDIDKEVGDHLGHRDPDTTRIYAKVNLTMLRRVAFDDLGGLQ